MRIGANRIMKNSARKLSSIYILALLGVVFFFMILL